MKTDMPVRRILLFLLTVLPPVWLCGPVCGAEPKKEKTDRQTLVFLNWSEYLAPDLVKAFERDFHAKVKEVFFETNEMRDGKLALTNGRGYDLVLISGLAVEPYAGRRWICPLNIAQIPNIRHIASRWRSAFPGAQQYAVPYTWGTLGIAWRRDLFAGNVSRWKHLFAPAESLRGKVMMIRDSNDSIGMALKSLGYSVNSTDTGQLGEAERLLLAQKPFVREYSYIMLDRSSGLITGDYHMAMVYNGDAVALQHLHPQIAFTVPEEGTNIWVDYLAVMESSDKKDLAHAFVNFLCKPENAARSASFLHYATPNTAAEKFLPPEHLSNPFIYPCPDILSRSEFYTKLPPRIKKERNEIFSRILKQEKAQ
ncbi:MAG: spermidine/putrescine ABC transporter substrate-binding protein [Desulfobacterales bacterium]